jgi:hypothetical protein
LLTNQKISAFLTDRIPLRIRAALYQAPLLIQWIIPLTWEKDAGVLRPGRRGLAFFLCLVGALTVLYIVHALIPDLGPGFVFVVDWIEFVLHSIIGLGYLFGSAYLSYREYAGQPFDVALLDRIADRFESLARR